MARTATKMLLFLSHYRTLRAFFSTNFVSDHPILVRDFIHSALYDPDLGYFSRRSGSIGALQRSIKFNQLNGRKAYMELVDKIYKQNGVSWFTPVELFKPWYAHGIAEAIMRTADLSVPLRIFEIGGGSGVCAKGIMDYIMLNAPTRVYTNMSYTCIEISKSLAERQVETIGEVGSHFSKFKVECRDAADASGWGEVQHQPCWVIMMEVLDNLPHDIIHSENQVSQWMEVWLQRKDDGVSSRLSEIYRPLSDPLLKKCISIMDCKDNLNTRGPLPMLTRCWSKLFPKPSRRWLPTGCLKLLEALHGAFSKMSLIASDFSYLPDVRIMGEGAPLVSRKIDGRSYDLDSYLDAQGDADIFFPTDFSLMERIDHHCSGWSEPTDTVKMGKKRRVITLDTSSFMEEFGLPSKTRTKDGYNPLLDDFKNTKFYLSVPTHNTKERVEIPKEKPFIYLKGEGKDATIIERDGHDPFIQWSSTFATWAENVYVKSIGFKNSYNFPVSQTKNSRRPAVAAMVAGDKTVFYDSGFYGLQDTLWDFQGRHYFRRCTIVGAVDFIFGNGQSIYEKCTIVAKAKTLGAGIIGYITAQGRTGPDKTDGFVFKECNVMGDGQSFLGRPWRTYARVIFFNTTMSNIVVPQGWALGNYASHIDKVTFVEYESRGSGSNPSQRVKWASKISKSAAETFTSLDYIDGDRWITYIPR